MEALRRNQRGQKSSPTKKWGICLAMMMTMLTGLPVSADAKSQAPECADWDGILYSENVYFLDPEVETGAQKALLDAKEEWGPLWLQMKYQHGALTVFNKTPGLGLPMSVYHIQVDWIGRSGEVVETQSFPGSTACDALSLFPGQESMDIPLDRPEVNETLRLQIKAWALPY